MIKKLLLPCLVILALLILIGYIFSFYSLRTIDWEESFNEKSNKPYGLSILYKELPNLFKPYKIKTVYHQPASYLNANSAHGSGDHDAKGNYIIIGNSKYLTNYSIDKLLDFVDSGNTLFISDYYFSQYLEDTLHFDVSFKYNTKKDSISTLSFKNTAFSNSKIDRNHGDYYFSSFDSINHTILGYSKIDKKRINFIKLSFGKGNILLHTEPKAFTNYNILKENRYTYVEHVLSYLPDDHVYFDSFTKRQTPYGNNEKESNLSWFLKQTPFRWAWYTALVFLLLFMIFNAKRRQRVIKIIKPVQNTSLAFIKTISNLYIETQDYKNLTHKKATYFLEKIRTDFNIDTAILNDDFIKKLASKAGRKEDDVAQLINYIKWLQRKDELTEQSLIKLNKFIEAFYSH